MAKYATEEAALKRVQYLRKQGVWTGVKRMRDGTFDLMHDPGDEIRL